VKADILVARDEEDLPPEIGEGEGASCVPVLGERVNTSTGDAPRKRRRATNPIPLDQRLLLELADAARLMSVSHRTAKRIAAEQSQLTVLVSRRRLFVRAKLLAWIEAGGDAAAKRR
jgi:hypothetical protein